jgi:hypothetical protein
MPSFPGRQYFKIIQISILIHRSLVAGCNKLRYLPGSFRRLHLDSLDLASNLFEPVLSTRDARRVGVLSLVECAARKVIKNRSV